MGTGVPVQEDGWEENVISALVTKHRQGDKMEVRSTCYSLCIAGLIVHSTAAKE